MDASPGGSDGLFQYPAPPDSPVDVDVNYEQQGDEDQQWQDEDAAAFAESPLSIAKDEGDGGPGENQDIRKRKTPEKSGGVDHAGQHDQNEETPAAENDEGDSEIGQPETKKDKQANKCQKAAGLWNYLPAECVAVVWACITASELGVTDEARLHQRVKDAYLQKAKELQRAGIWAKRRAWAANHGGFISPEKSFAARSANPSALWKKGCESIRREIQMNLAKIYQQVKAENHSGWSMKNEIDETKLRYYNYLKGIKDKENFIMVPDKWVNGAWETFLKFGAPGMDEAWLKETAKPRQANKSRAQVKGEKKRHAAAAQKADPMPDGEEKDEKPQEDEIGKLLNMMTEVKASMDQNNQTLQRVADVEEKKLAAKEKKVKMDHLKLMIDLFPPTSPEYQEALNALRNIVA